MKGSMKLKFDFGWVFSATLALGILVFSAARVSLALEIQERLETSCQLFEQSAYAALDKDPGDKKGLVTKTCINNYKKSTLSVIMDTNIWSFQDAYPNVVEILKN